VIYVTHISQNIRRMDWNWEEVICPKTNRAHHKGDAEGLTRPYLHIPSFSQCLDLPFFGCESLIWDVEIQRVCAVMSKSTYVALAARTITNCRM
jgi:hypothetical protein